MPTEYRTTKLHGRRVYQYRYQREDGQWSGWLGDGLNEPDDKSEDELDEVEPWSERPWDERYVDVFEINEPPGL